MTKTCSGTLLAFILVVPCIAQAQPMSYYQGPIVANPRVQPVYWGDTENSSTITKFYIEAISQVNWLDWDYHVGSTRISNGLTLTPVTITPTHGTSTAVQWHDIRDQLSDLIATGVVPPQDAGLIYAFHFPSTVSVYLWDGRRMCDYVWGEHGTWTDWLGPGTQMPLITVVPTCGTFDSVTALAYHELVEEITDPLIGHGWTCVNATPPNQNGEVADLCAGKTALLHDAPTPPPPYGPPYLHGTYVAAQAWSNTVGCVAPEPQLADPLGVHVMAGRSTTVPFMAGGACVAYNGTCSATGSSDSGQLTFSFSSANNLGANNGTATITAALSAGSGTYLVAFNVYNNATHYATDGASWVTVDPCVPWDCTGRCGNPSNGCGGTLSCSPCDPPPDPGCIHPVGTQCP